MSEEIGALKKKNLQQQVKFVVNDCIRRRADGEVVTDESLIEAHSDLMPELAEQLRRLRLIEKVQSQFDNQDGGELHNLCIRCPDCRSPIALTDDTQLSDVTCSTCGCAFGLIGDPKCAAHAQLERVGHFSLTERLGVGAFGTVWRAHDTELDREVAVKIPRKGQLSGEDAERLVREARAAAQLSHPNIVQVFEVGREGEDLYIVTDIVEGRDLADRLTMEPATPGEAAKLCATLADALEHAHQRGVIHRDLKPSNIAIDSAGEPHLMDFGLAKREADDVTMTIDGKLLGTPAYMSPEQARGAAHEADRRSDIFSLGVILYELLTGERPFRGNTRMLVHQILVEDAPGLRKLNNRVPKDLEIICLKCLAKSADQRYQTAGELGDDLRRFLRGEPIRARPISAATRVWRWAKRNTGLAVSTGTAAILLLTLGVAGPLIALGQRRQAELYRRRSYVADMQVAHQQWQAADVEQVAALLKRHMLYPGRGFEWFYLWQRYRSTETTRTIPYDAPGHIAFSPDGRLFAVAGRRNLTIWDGKARKKLGEYEAHTYLVKGLAFSPDGRTLATGGWDGVLKLWHVTYEHEAVHLSAPIVLHADRNMTYHDLAFSPDGKLLATNGASNKKVPIWDVERRCLASELEGHEAGVLCVAFSPNATLATGDWSGSVRLWNVRSGRQIVDRSREDLDGHEDGVNALAFSPDGATLASGSVDDTVKLWDVSTGKLRMTLEGHSNAVTSVAFSPDGATLASAASDGVIKLWKLPHRKREPATLKGHTGDVLHLAFSPDGKVLASAGTADEQVRIWDLTLPPPQETFEGRRVSYDARGEALTLWIDDLPQLCHESVDLTERAPASPGTVCTADSLDGKTSAKGYEDGTIEIHLLESYEKRVLPEQHNGPIAHLLFSPDGKMLVSAGGPPRKPVLNLWDVATGKVLTSMDVFWLAYPVFSADSKVLATVNEDRNAGLHSIKLWHATGEEPTTIIEQQVFPYFSLAISTCGEMLAAGNLFGEITIWDLRTGEKLLGPLKTHTSNVYCLAFSPDSTRLASCSYDRTVVLTDTSTGDEMITLKGHRRSVWSVGFSPDGNTLASASADGVVTLWTAATPEELQTAGR